MTHTPGPPNAASNPGQDKPSESIRIVLEAAPLCCHIWNVDGGLMDCNQEAFQMFGLIDTQSLVDPFDRLSPEHQPDGAPSKDKIHTLFQQALAQGATRFEWQYRTLEGEPIPAEVTLRRIRADGQDLVVGYSRDLRPLQALMEDMREVDERTRIMLDATPLCCNFWDENYDNIDCNLEAVKLFRLQSKQEYLERFFELSPVLQPCGRNSGEMAYEYIFRAFKDGYVRFEWIHQTLDGEPVPSEITLVRLNHRGKFIVAGYTRDLRELKTTLEKMREADERMQIMLDAMPLCCTLWDEDFNLIDCNQAVVKLFDLKSKEEFMARFFELSPMYQPDGKHSALGIAERMARAFAEGFDRFEWVHQKIDGEPIPTDITLVRVRHREKDIVAGYVQDLREFKKMLKERQQVEDELRIARDAAEESTRAKSEFLANMSHEIRTPMNAILGMLHLLLGTEVTEKQRDYLNKTRQSAKALLRIINDILDFSKIEAGKLEMENVAFSMAQVVDELTNMFAPRMQEKGLGFEIVMPDDPTELLSGDPLRLGQVLINLVSNALKFTSQGKITVQIDRQPVIADKTAYRFSVTDTGIGMDKHQMEQLFAPFTQADTSTTRKYGGTGLGLAISKNLVQRMYGDIWVESRPDQGSTFYFTAQFDRFEGKDAMRADRNSCGQTEMEIAKNAQSSTARPRRVLLAEDNEINQMITRELLESEGYVMDVASNGREAVDMLLIGEYDLVLMDIQMPVMDGLIATQEIRRHERFASLPIVAMSAHAMSGDREKSLAAGMNDHLTKPIDPVLLSDALRKWIRG